MKKILSAALAAILLAGLLSACSFELPHGPVEKQAWLDELPRHYSAVGYGQLAVNEGPDGNPLSLYEKQTAADGTESFAEREFSHGFYAHATSTLVFEELETQGFFRLETYVGINSTARTENTRASVRFFIFVDDEEAYASPVMDAWTPMEHVSLDIAGADRITLYADMVESNGNDHAVWADCKLSYFDEIGVSLVADDIEFPSPAAVTRANILANARASKAGEDVSDDIENRSDYVPGKTGEFEIVYSVGEGASRAEKKVRMTVGERSFAALDDAALRAPFANYVYYGRSLLGIRSRKAYDLLLRALLNADLSDRTVTSATVDLQAAGVPLLPSDVRRIKEYLLYDEPRVYYIYDWRQGTGARYFSAKYGIDKSIRDNQPWGMYANATFRVYADGVLLFERSGVGWKTDYGAIAVLLPEGTRTLTPEVTDTSGQGGTGWGDCALYA